MAGKRFETVARTTTGTKTGEGAREEIPFEVADTNEPDGYRQCMAYMPTDEQAAFVTKLASRYMSTPQKLAGALEFMEDVLETETTAYLVARMRENPPTFTLHQLVDLLVWLAAEFKAKAGGRTGVQNTPVSQVPNRAERRAATSVRQPTQFEGGSRYVPDQAAPPVMSVAELARRAGVDPGVIVAASDLPAPAKTTRRPAAKAAPAKAAKAAPKKAAPKRPAAKQVRAR